MECVGVHGGGEEGDLDSVGGGMESMTAPVVDGREGVSTRWHEDGGLGCPG